MSNRRREFIFLLIQAGLDAASVYAAFIMAYRLRFSSGIFPLLRGIPVMELYARPMPVVIVLYLLVFNWSGLYDSHRIVYRTDEFLAVLKSAFISIVLITAATFLYREFSYSRLVVSYAFPLSAAFVYASHCFVKFIKNRVVSGGAPGIAVIGGLKSKDRLIKNIARSGRFNLHHLPEADLIKIRELTSAHKINEIVLVDMDTPREIVMKLINFCEGNEIEFKMVPDMIELKMGEMSFDRYFGLPVLSLKHPLLEPSNYYVKRSMDIIAAMALLAGAGPLLILLCILIRIDSPGPVIYSHLRKGFRGKDFPFFKFRSMVLDADSQLKKLMKYNERSPKAFKMRNDPRVTRVGRFIRKFSIDEIPQLYNVLRGDMSLVGPRPQVLWEATLCDDEANRRLNILPGITGLWQVSGRSDLTYEEMISLDLYYLENWTPGLDFKILIRTFGVVASRKGAC